MKKKYWIVILSFLNGNDKILKDKIMEKIKVNSDNLNFEVALELKKELDYIDVVLAKQKIDFTDLTNRDVIGYYFNQGYIAIQILFIRNGKLVGSSVGLIPVISDFDEEINNYLLAFYERHEKPKEVLISEEVNCKLLEEALLIKFASPSRGNKRKLIYMANKNAEIYYENEMELLLKKEEFTNVANKELQELLKLPILDRIDLFDNSNLFGDFSVSCMVVFKNGKASKNDYRKYKISFDKNDDYNMMKEVIYRRYQRALVEQSELPNLIIVDGGLNQIHACKEILNMLNLNIKVCGLKKNDKHRTNDLVDGDTEEVIDIPKDSKVFHYLTRMQDEVHRYTITYHRTIRSKGSIGSILDNISGIGSQRRKALIKKFGSVKKIEQASLEELETILPTNTAKRLQEYLETRKEEK